MARAVSVTYGPHGRIALLDRFAGLLPTKDGVTVAREIQLNRKPQDLGADILKNTCIAVNDNCGDGTTTAAIVAAALLQEGHKLIVAGADPRVVCNELQTTSSTAIEALRELSVRADSQEDLNHVARIASNGDEEVARCLAEGVMAVGKDGTLSIEDGYGVETVLEYKDGFECEARLSSPIFLGPVGKLELEGALVAVIDQPLNSIEDVVPILEEASQWPQNPLLIFAPSFGWVVNKTIAMNLKANNVTAYPVLAPGVHIQKAEHLKDIAALSGAVFVDPSAGHNIRKWKPEWFGALRRARVDMKASLLEGYDEPDKRDTRAARIRELCGIERTTTSEYDLDRIKERKANLSGGFLVLRVGAVTESALKERRARVEDAFGAVRAALKGGLVPGGGTAYLRAAEALRGAPRGSGGAILRQALRAPAMVLLANGGLSARQIISQIDVHKSPWAGWDARTGEVRDLSKDPKIADPTNVAVGVVKAAVSIATTLLSVECSICKA